MSLRRRVPVSAECSKEQCLNWQQANDGKMDHPSERPAGINWDDCPAQSVHNSIASLVYSRGNPNGNRNPAPEGRFQKTYTFLEKAQLAGSGNKHVHFDTDEIPEEMKEFFAWKQMYYEEEIQKLKRLPEKIPRRRANPCPDDDTNQNHFPGGGGPLSGSAMRNNLLGAIQLKRTTSSQPEEKFDPTKSVGNLRYEGPKEDPEPSTSQAAPPPAAPPKQASAAGGNADPMKNLIGAIQLKRTASSQPEEKFDPTKSVGNLRYEGPKEEPEPSISQVAPPPKKASSVGGNVDPMKNLLGAIHQKKPETDFVEEKFDPTMSVPNLSYKGPVEEENEVEAYEEEEVVTEPEYESVAVMEKTSPLKKRSAPQYDENFVSSRSVRIMNNQSTKEFTTPGQSSKEHTPPKKVPTKPILARNSQTQTRRPPSLTSLLSAAQPERQSSTRVSASTGVDNSVSLVRPSLVRFSQQTTEHPIEAVREAMSRESARGVEIQEPETIISSLKIPSRESIHSSREVFQEMYHARPLLMVNEDNTIRTVMHKHELKDILRDTIGDQMPEMPRELQSYIEKFQDVPLNKLMHFAETGSYLRESYVNSNICDIRVHVGKDTIPAHRIVLACFSPYLASVLEHENPLKQKKPKDIRISGVSEQSVKDLLNYIYTGELQIDTVQIPDFIKLAEKFDVSAVRQKCFDHVFEMTDDELVALLSVMKDTLDVEYCDCIMKNIASKFMRVRESKTFLQLDVDTLCLILSYDALILRSEMDIFYSCLNWLQSGDTKERNKYLDRVMDCVRFPLMNHAMLYECVEKCSLLKSSASCIQKIHEANWLMTMSMLNKQDPLRLAVPSHRNNVNCSASVSDYIMRTCGRVKSDVTVEVAREGSPTKTYHSEPANAKVKQSPSSSRGGTQNNNAADVDGESTCDDEARPANQIQWENADLIRDCGQTDKMDPSRNHTIVFLNKRMYMIGGCHTMQGEMTPRKEVLVYDKICGTWKPLAPLLTARMYHSLCVVKGQIYAIGGLGEDNSILNTVECYDPSSNCWYFVKSMAEARMGACAAEYGGQIYIAGGYGSRKMDLELNITILDSFECFNPHSNKWTPKRNLRYGRCHANIMAVGHSLFLCGGVSIDRSSPEPELTSVADVDEYDVTTDTWVLKTCLLKERHDACCVKSDDKIYLVGGISTKLGQSLGDTECFDPQENVTFTPSHVPHRVDWIKCATSKE